MGETSWAFLLIGSFAAVGAAMAIGTLAALVRYHRSGVWPGHHEVDEAPGRRLAALWLRVVVGLLLFAVGANAIVRAGIW